MDTNRIFVFAFIIIMLVSVQSASASQNSTDGLSDIQLNEGESCSLVIEAIEMAQANDTIYLDDGNYNEHDIEINKSLTIIGKNSTIFDGLYANSLFTIDNASQVTFKNINFINYCKEGNGAVFDIKRSSSVILINCKFINNTAAISNFGNLYIYDSYFDNNSLDKQYSAGGAISNEGKLYIENTTFKNSHGTCYTFGATIYNNGDLTFNRSTIANAYAQEESKGSALYNNKIARLIDSVFEGNTIERYNFNYMMGTVFNQGNLTSICSIFRNNTGKYVKPNTWYEGTPTIYNTGNLNLSCNAFISNVYFKGLALDVFNKGSKSICLDGNWWQTNENPIDAGRINEGNAISTWIVLEITPDYSALAINESVEISASLRLNNGENIAYNLLSKFNITFESMFDAKGSYENNVFTFNHTQEKGTYNVTVSFTDYSLTAVVDVGKIPVHIYLEANGSITYPENLFISFSTNLANETVTITLNNERFTTKLVNGRGNVTFINLVPDTYVLSLTYGGDENHFKAFNSTTVTVNKMEVSLGIENIRDIKSDETLVAYITLSPNVSPVTAQLYINGVFTKTIYLYNSSTELTFTNMREGRYNITVFISQTENYFSANISRSFNVGRYDPQLGINVSDIHLGENLTVFISSNNFTGYVNLLINNQSNMILVNNDTNITVPNLEGGIYNISIIYAGDDIYMPSSSSATFRVIRNNPDLNVDITQMNKTGIIEVTANASATGRIGVYVNFEAYYQNLTDGRAAFNVEFDSGTNYVFVFYDGDRLFENETYNTTVIFDEEFILLGDDVEVFEYNDFIYSVRLIEKNRITMPNRNVTIMFNGQEYNITTDKDGIASITLNLARGSYSIAARYKNETVTNNILVKEVDFDILTETIVYGETETVNVIFNQNITGGLNFNIDNVLNRDVTINSSKAVLSISDLNADTYNLKVTFTNAFISKSINATFEVKKADPMITVMANNIRPSEDEIIEVTVSDDITGNIIFKIGNSTHVRQIIDSKAVLNLTNLEKGIYNLSVSYGGNQNYNPATHKSSFSVRDLETPIEFSINSPHYGENIVVSVKLNSTASGKITFEVAGISKTVDVINGEAKCIFTNIGAGTYKINAKYEGDMTFADSANYTFVRVMKATSEISIVTGEITLGENILIYAVLSPNATGEVYFSMTNYYSPRAKEITDGTAIWYISPLEAGRYEVVASYMGDSNYNPSNTTFTLKVSQVKSFLSVSINDVTSRDNVKASISLHDLDDNPITGYVKLIIRGKTYSVYVNNGKGSFVIGKMPAGNYTYSVVFEGDEDYSTSSAGGQFEVAEDLLRVELTSNNITAYYKGPQILTITLTSNGKPISGESITVKVNGVSYNLVTDYNGKANLSLDLKPETYTASVTFNQTLSYSAATANAKIRILSSINATDVVKLYGTGTQYFAMFYTKEGKALANTVVKFTLAGKTYKVKTLPNGVVRLNININCGTYKITAINPQTGEKKVNTIRIFKKIMSNKDVTQLYGAGKVYKVRIYNATTAKAVGAGKIVKFRINGKTYNVKTDKNGWATFKFNLAPKTYTVRASFDGYSVSNKIVVKPLISARNILGKNIKKLDFKVKAIDSKGKVAKNKVITVKFRGNTYKAKTNAKGIAIVGLKNLKIGNYKIISIYGKSKITNTIKITK